MKLTIVLLLLLYVVSYVQSQDCSSLPIPDYQCSSFCSPFSICEIKNYNQWDSVEATGAATPGTVYSTRKSFTFKTSGMKTISFTLGNCTINVYPNITIPKFTIVQPKCFADNVTVTMVSGFDPLYTNISINSGPYYNVSLGSALGPWRNYYNQDIITINIKSSIDRGNYYYTCTMYAEPEPVNGAVPILEIVHPKCRQANGSVRVTNYQQFEELFMSVSGGPNVTAVNGLFDGLNATLTSYPFKIYSKPPGCPGYDVRSDYIYNTQPVISYIGKSLPGCNNTHGEFTPIVTGIPVPPGSNITMNYNLYIVGQTYILPYGNYDMKYTDQGCSVSTNLGFNQLSFNAITHTLNPPQLTCQNPNSTVTLSYGGSSLSDIYLTSTKYGSISLNAQNQFTLTYGDTVSVNNKCMGKIYKINYPLTMPIYDYSGNRDDCVGNATFVVQNYFKFSNLTLVKTTYPNTVYTIDLSTGIVQDIYFGSYVLWYSENGCQNSQMSIILYPAVSYLDNKYFTFEVVDSDPFQSCSDNLGWAIVRPYYKDIPSLVTTNVTFANPYSSNYATFYNPRCPNNATAPFYAGDLAYAHITNVTVIQAPTCSSSSVVLQIESNSPISYLSVNSTTYAVAGNKQYTVPAGPIQLLVYYQSYNQMLYLNNPPIDPDYQFDYSIVPQQTDNCTVQSGSFTLTNTTGFYSAKFNGASSTNSSWVIGSGYYTLSYNHSYCGVGSLKNIHVPTSEENVQFKTTIVSPASCFFTYGDGSLYINATTKVGDQVVPLDDLRLWGSIYKPAIQVIQGLPGGNSVISISSSQFCKWNIPVFVPIRSYGQVYQASIVNLPTNKYHTGRINLTQINQNVDIYEIDVNNNALVSFDASYIFQLDYERVQAVTVGYNQYCYQTYYVNTTNPNYMLQPVYKQITTNQCGNVMPTIQFTPESMATFNIYIVGYGNVPPNGTVLLPAYSSISAIYTNLITGDSNSYYSIYTDSSVNNLQINPTVTVANETCSGSRDGTLTVSGIDFATYSATLYSGNSYQQQSIVVSGKKIFQTLSSGSYILTIASLTDASCVYTKTYVVSSSEPVIYVKSTSSCSVSGAVVNFGFAPNNGNLQYKVSLDGVLVPNTGIITGVGVGSHRLMLNITTASCPRVLVRQVNVDYHNFTLYAESNSCNTISFWNDQPSGFQRYFVYELYNSNNQVIATLDSNTMSMGFSNIAVGSYKVAMVDISGCRVFTNVQVTPTCTPNPTSSPTTSSSSTTSSSTSTSSSSSTSSTGTGTGGSSEINSMSLIKYSPILMIFSLLLILLI